MIVQFRFSGKFEKESVFFCANFPEINLQVGDTIFMDDFKCFLQKGEIYDPYDPEEGVEYCELDEVYDSAQITDITHTYSKERYIKLITVKAD